MKDPQHDECPETRRAQLPATRLPHATHDEGAGVRTNSRQSHSLFVLKDPWWEFA